MALTNYNDETYLAIDESANGHKKLTIITGNDISISNKREADLVLDEATSYSILAENVSMRGDTSLSLNGKDLMLIARDLSITDPGTAGVTISTKGLDGTPPDPAKTKPGRATDGGDDGQSGLNGGTVADGLAGKSGANGGSIDLITRSITVTTSLKLVSDGGKGGDGQNGQAGQDGGNGHEGHHAFQEGSGCA